MNRDFVVKFRIAAFGPVERQLAIEYWSKRGVRFALVQEDRLEGVRGSTLWSKFLKASIFDNQRKTSNLSIRYLDDGLIDCVLVVSTPTLLISEWELASSQIEIENFRSLLQNGDERDHVWQELRERYNRHATGWTHTGESAWNKLRADDRAWLAALSSPEVSLPIPGAGPPKDTAALPVASDELTPYETKDSEVGA